MAGTWFKFLDRSVRIPSSPNLEIVGRVACDQLIFAPFNMGLFLTTMSVLEGSDPKKKLQDNYWTGLTTNWKVWPAVQLINFKMVPLDHRLLVVNVISLGMFSRRISFVPNAN
jgi:protein Mpv17